MLNHEYKSMDELLEENKKLKIQKKMMEISFEQINDSRNDMIRQLAECEAALGKKQ